MRLFCITSIILLTKEFSIEILRETNRERLMSKSLEQVYGIANALIEILPPPEKWQRAPTTSDTIYPLGFQVIYNSTIYEYVGSGIWLTIGGASAVVETLTGDSGGAISPTAGNINLLGGTGISTSGSGSTITFNVVGGGVKTTVVTADTQMAINNAYVVNKSASAGVMTLPATAAVGSFVRVIGLSSNGWSVAQNSGQSINMNSVSTTTGTGGSLASTARYNSVDLICVVANTTWNVIASEGVLTVT